MDIGMKHGWGFSGDAKPTLREVFEFSIGALSKKDEKNNERYDVSNLNALGAPSTPPHTRLSIRPKSSRFWEMEPTCRPTGIPRRITR